MERRNGPLLQCRDRLNETQNRVAEAERRNTDVATRVRDGEGTLQRLQNNIRELQQNRGQGWSCTVKGRHGSHSAEGRTRVEALRQAVLACGRNGCGKEDWNSSNYSCRLK